MPKTPKIKLQSLIITAFALSLTLIPTSPASAQDETGEGGAVSSTAPPSEESTGLSPEEIEALILAPREGELFLDSSYLVVSTVEMKSPTGALLRSLVLPGWGQFYNRAWWKGLLVIGGEATLAAIAVRQYLKSKDYLSKARETSGAESDYNLSQYQHYQVEAEKYGWFFVGVLVFSMLDAYVDAHLYDWDVGDIEREEEADSVEDKFSLALLPRKDGFGLAFGFSF